MAGAAAAIAGSTQAYGQIIPIASLPSDITSNPATGANTIEYYNVLTGVTTPNQVPGDDFRFEVASGPYGGGTFANSAVVPIQLKDSIAVTNAALYPPAAAISAGTKIGSDTYSFSSPTAPFTGAPGTPEDKIYLVGVYDGTPYTAQQPNSPTYLGFQFADATGNIHDGYFELETTVDATTGADTLEFLNGAYNSAVDTGNGSGDITAGEMDIPEPGTLSSLVLGAAALAGVGLMRRRRTVPA